MWSAALDPYGAVQKVKRSQLGALLFWKTEGTPVRQNGRRLRNAFLASTIGWTLAASILVGYGLGWFLQKYFGLGDWVVFVCVLLGVIAGFVEMFRLVLRLSKDEDQE